MPLQSLQNRNLNIKHINNKINYLLCDPFIFVNVYANISKNKGALTKGIPSDEEIMKITHNPAYQFYIIYKAIIDMGKPYAARVARTVWEEVILSNLGDRL